MTRQEVEGTPPAEWTPAHDAAFATLILEALSRARTLIWVMPDQAGRVSHWVEVWDRFHGAHMAEVHTGGVGRQKGAIRLNASAWPATDRTYRGSGRTREQNTRVEAW